MIIVASVINRN